MIQNNKQQQHNNQYENINHYNNIKEKEFLTNTANYVKNNNLSSLTINDLINANSRNNKAKAYFNESVLNLKLFDLN